MKVIGEKTQAIVLTEFIKKNIPISIPFGDNQRYDYIIDVNGNLYKIQVKTASYKNGSISFSTSSSSIHRGGKRKNYKGQVDYFAVYSYETNEVYLLEVDELGNREAKLRLEPTKNNQKINIRYAKDYCLDIMLSKM